MSCLLRVVCEFYLYSLTAQLVSLTYMSVRGLCVTFSRSKRRTVMCFMLRKSSASHKTTQQHCTHLVDETTILCTMASNQDSKQNPVDYQNREALEALSNEDLYLVVFSFREDGTRYVVNELARSVFIDRAARVREARARQQAEEERQRQLAREEALRAQQERDEAEEEAETEKSMHAKLEPAFALLSFKEARLLKKKISGKTLEFEEWNRMQGNRPGAEKKEFEPRADQLEAFPRPESGLKKSWASQALEPKKPLTEQALLDAKSSSTRPRSTLASSDEGGSFL